MRSSGPFNSRTGGSANFTGGSRCVCLWLFLVLGVTAACGDRPHRLQNTYRSPSELARAVLEAVTARNRADLRGLALNESEFREHVWPELPAARPERNLPFSYVWGDLHQKSEQALTRTLAASGGRKFELLDVRFSGLTDYRSYRVHREAEFVVRSADGEATIRLCGSMFEKDGGWKVFSYVIDD